MSYRNALRKLFRTMGQRLCKRAIHFYISSSYKNVLHISLVNLSMQVKVMCVAILIRSSKSHWMKTPEWVITIEIHLWKEVEEKGHDYFRRKRLSLHSMLQMGYSATHYERRQCYVKGNKGVVIENEHFRNPNVDFCVYIPSSFAVILDLKIQPHYIT